MAPDRQTSAARRRRSRLSGWVLSQFQVTLAICGIVVGFLVCFGLGFLSGVWFQTQEQIVPHDDAVTLAEDQLDREVKASSPDQEMTFYSALPSRDGTPEPQLQPQTTTPVPQPEHPSPSTVASPTPSVASQLPPLPIPEVVEPGVVKPGAVAEIRSTPLPAAASARPVPSESQVEAPAVPEPKPEASSAVASEDRFYSIQVGSFRQAEQAYGLRDQLVKKGYQARIDLSIVAGKGAWYRVRVGRYADRGVADQTAQRLQKSENIDVLVMRVSS